MTTEMTTEMEQLVAAFAAMSSNTKNSKALSPAAHPVQMEDLIATFASSLTMSSNDDNLAAPPTSANPGAAVPNLRRATTSTEGAEDDHGDPAKGEGTCVLRVRFPNGRFLSKKFGGGLPTAALFQYCRTMMRAVDASARGRAFRLVKLAGGASDVIRASPSTTLRDLRLDRCTVYVVPF